MLVLLEADTDRVNVDYSAAHNFNWVSPDYFTRSALHETRQKTLKKQY